MPLSVVLPHLPRPLREEISHALSAWDLQEIKPSEVRMRRDRIASLTFFKAGRLSDLPLSYVADEEALRSTFSHAVGGSLYAYEEALKEGYVSLSRGVRVGVAGRVFCKGDSIVTVTSVDSLVFRLPCGAGRADALFSFYKESLGGILLFSPPGGGKTTLLRAFAARAARGERVAVIDPREELLVEGERLLVDRLVGYPKAKGAEIAVRTLTPDLLILDEIGAGEARALSALAAFGVRTVASAHGGSKEELWKSPALTPLFTSGMFSHLWDVRQSVAYPWEENT